MKECLLNSSTIPDWLGGIIFLLIIVSIAVAVSRGREKREKEAEAERKAKELEELQFYKNIEQNVENFKQNGLPQIDTVNIQLTNNEQCCFYSEAILCKIKNRVVGYEGGYGGQSIRIAKGFSIRTGGMAKRAVRSNVEFTTKGHLYVTNKKIIFIAPSNSKTININSIISLNIYNNYVVVLNNKEENMFAAENLAMFFSILQFLIQQH
ncbi:MAG: hypothetical protein MJ054_00800 [Clostridia bacterium]|nr:hypothetical protein [Clostridia bacterium]